MKFHSISAAGFLLSASVVSAAPAAESKLAPKQVEFLDILAKGGIMVYPLALLSVVAVALILIYMLTIRRNAVVSDRFMDAAESMIRKRDYLGLTAYCHRSNQCIARITQKTVEFISNNPGVTFENVRDVAQTEGSRQAGVLISRITYLSEIGAIAPMVGLLGTVLGMIEAFIEISNGEVQGVRQMGLADGVSKALIATAFGLAISILAFAFYSVFRGRVQKYIAELEAAATHLIALLHVQFERQTVQSFPAPALRPREDYAMPVSPLGGDRQDVHGL